MKHNIFICFTFLSLIIPCLKAMEIEKKIKREEPSFSQEKNYEKQTCTPGASQYLDSSDSSLSQQANEHMAVAQREFRKATNFYKQAAKKGDKEALYTLANLYQKGYLGKKNRWKADKLYDLAASHGHPKAQYKWGNIYYNRALALEKWYFRTLDNLGEEANGNYLLFHESEEIDDTYLKARQFFYPATYQNHAKAQYKLGKLLFNGKGGDRDYNEGLKLLHLSSAQGCKQATYFLIDEYYSGEFIPEDYEKYFQLSQDLANQNDIKGKYELAWNYLRGLSIEQNFRKSAELFFSVGLQGHTDALRVDLSKMYKKGQGVAMDLAKAHQLASITPYISEFDIFL